MRQVIVALAVVLVDLLLAADPQLFKPRSDKVAMRRPSLLLRLFFRFVVSLSPSEFAIWPLPLTNIY